MVGDPVAGAVDLPIVVDFSLDYRVLTFALVLSLVTGVAFGLAPALKATKVDLVPTLRDDGETRSSGRRWLTLKNALVVIQVAVSVVMLGVTSMFLQMLSASRTQRVGFAIDGVAMLETDARYAGYSGTDAANVFEDLRRRVAAIPGVQSAVLTRGLPMQTAGTPVVTDDADADRYIVRLRRFHLGWPRLFRSAADSHPVRPAAGRAGSPDTPRVAVISETMARQVLRRGQRRGRRFRARAGTEWMDGGRRRGAGHRDGRPGRRSRRSHAATVLSIVRAIGTAARHGARADIARCGRPARPDAAGTPQREPRAAGDYGEDDGAVPG